MKNHLNIKWLIVVLIIVFSGILLLSRMINQQIGGITEISPSPAQAIKTINVPKREARKEKEVQTGILRVERKNPKNSYTESIITVDGTEVARFKREDEKIFDMQGAIPDGKIKFTNKWESTYGFEHYRNGKREGLLTAYYKNGQIHSKANYRNGHLRVRKSYYHGGILRMEEDYTNASFVSNFLKDAFERVGTGKIYRLSGSLKYEWHITDDAKQYYTKRYNAHGKVIQENFYNTDGELIKKEQDSSESPLEPEVPL